MTCPCGKHRTLSGCKGAQYLASRGAAQRKADGRAGGRTRAVIWRGEILARYQHLDRDDAILQAWKDSSHVWKLRRQRLGKLVGAKREHAA